MKTGLVMEGGAMRGMFTCGVIDVLMEHGITFDGAAGTSAGAAFGCNYKSKQIGRPLRYNKRFCNDRRYCSFWSFLTTGDLYNAEFCYKTVPYELDIFDVDTFKENPMEFYATTTDLSTGKTVYHKFYDGSAKDILWLRASASMPVVSRPVEISGRRLLDGGISDSIPYRFMEHMGYEKNVIILTQPADYVKKKNKLTPLVKLLYHKHPAFVRAFENRHLRYNEDTAYIAEREVEGACFVIRPKESLHIGSAEKDPKELERVYMLGREAMEEKLSEMMAFLEE